ncbi:hypothetical protein JXD38_02375 [candidate division WOR-3 bacterium]|nr:hypothetical protein [candidate division WOR-3 bacterium]
MNDVPVSVELPKKEAARLLHESRALLLRYPGPTTNEPTGWYYVVCDSVPDLEALGKRDRRHVRIGYERCSVQRVEPGWLAERGYSCYAAAMSSRGLRPGHEWAWSEYMLNKAKGPFEYWVVLVAGELAAYCERIICGEWVHHSYLHYHPEHLRNRIVFALTRNLQEEYVLKRGMKLVNGTRTVLHDTSYNDVLQRLGFRLVHCQLGIAYRPQVALAVAFAYPLRELLAWLPRVPGVAATRAVLTLEGIRRSQHRLRREPVSGGGGTKL